MDVHAYMCFDVRVAVSDPREVSPAAHQSLNIAVLYTVLHSFSKKSINSWNTGQDMDVMFLCGTVEVKWNNLGFICQWQDLQLG